MDERELGMAILEVPGCALHYDVRGRGEPLVLVHGTGADATTWDPVIDLLAADHQVITYDRRGYGRSTHRPVRDYRLHTNDLAALLEQVCDRPAHVVGWSSGGNVAMALAAADPSRMRSLCVIEPPFHNVRLGDRAVLAATIRVKWQQCRGRRIEAGEKFFRSVYALRSGGNAYDLAADRVREGMRRNVEPVLVEFDPHPFGVSVEYVATRAVAAAPVPMTWILGDQSPAWLHRIHHRFTRHRSDLHTVVIPNVGHLAHDQDPEAFAKAVTSGA
ncbi:alpha/beta fold hydrolase [Mycobacterium sp. NPDC050041]|uniref:alpha/beta fold hydrolase n=1 Tax=Mycobacterium sp. NPDC050041 TaxID=3364293 RepID=UPI003C2EC68F